MSNPLATILTNNVQFVGGDQVVLERELAWLYGVARDADQVFFRRGSVVIDPSDGVVITNPDTGKDTIYLQSDGDMRAGSDLADPASTSLALFSQDQIYNGEELGEGDLLLGDNSSGKANLLWDVSAGQLKFRGGTTTQVYIDTDGTLVAGGGDVILGADGIILNQGDANVNKIRWLQAGTDEVGSIYNSGGQFAMRAGEGGGAGFGGSIELATYNDSGVLKNRLQAMSYVSSNFWTQWSAYTMTLESDTQIVLAGGAAPTKFSDIGVHVGTLGTTPAAGHLEAQYKLTAWGDGSSYGVQIGSDGQIYRSASNVLRTPDTFQGDVEIKAPKISATGDGASYGLFIGTDTQIYRNAANQLTTPDTLTIGGNLWTTGYGVFSAATSLYLRNNTARINFGTADDVNLYRWAANSLRTNDQFTVDGVLNAGYNDSSGWGLRVYHGTTWMGEFHAIDTTWTRINTNVAKNIYTPRIFRADGGLVAGNAVGAASDVTYRGNLRAFDGATYRDVYGIFPLQAEIASATFFGTGKGNSAGAYYTASSEFSGVPSAAKAIMLSATIKHTSTGAWFECGVNSTNRNSVVVYNQTTSAYNSNSGVVPLDASGRVYIRTSTNSMEIWLRCTGYFT